MVGYSEVGQKRTSGKSKDDVLGELSANWKGSRPGNADRYPTSPHSATIPRWVGKGMAPCAFIRSHHDDGLSPTMRALACFLQLGTPGQAAHSSNRRVISMSLHPNRMREPHNMKGTP